MNTVVVTVDARKFPMEIAEHMLSLGKDLNMATGVTGYYEAYNRLLTYLESLTVYHTVMWPADSNRDFCNQQKAVERYLTMHTNNQNLIHSQARTLLDFIHYFPVAAVEEPALYEYEKVLDQDERTGN